MSIKRLLLARRTGTPQEAPRRGSDLRARLRRPPVERVPSEHLVRGDPAPMIGPTLLLPQAGGQWLWLDEPKNIFRLEEALQRVDQ